MQELNKLETLRDIIDKGEYIVALCGSGMMEECGIHPLKDQDRAYRIEERYGRSPEYLYTDAFFNTRTETFYDFYRNELLVDLEPTASTYTLAAMERAAALIDTEAVSFYDKYAAVLSEREERDRYDRNYHTLNECGELRFGRPFQLLLLYKAGSCQTLGSWFSRVFQSVEESIERNRRLGKIYGCFPGSRCMYMKRGLMTISTG